MLRTFPRWLILASVLMLALALAAQARPRYRREFTTAYPKTKATRLDGCITCHATAPPALNPYGVALRKASLNFLAVEREDSDGDGATNRKEIDALSFPGNPKDRPGAAMRDSAAADSAKRDSVQVAPRDTSGVLPDSLNPKKG
jgi:hypothetical protein